MTSTNGGPIERALDLALSLDRDELRAQHAALRAKYPSEDDRTLADRLIASARWKGAAVGFGTGLPTNPWVAVPAAVADVGMVLRMEVVLAARIALLFDEHYLDDHLPPYELLAPIMGNRMIGEALRELAIRGGMGVTRQAIRAILTKQTLVQFRRAMLKYLGLKVGQRAVIAKTLPIVGGLIGGGWNLAEITAVGRRTFAYFEGRPLAA